jgi:hypothetical protein
MKKTKTSLNLLMLLSIIIFLSGCAAYKPTKIQASDTSNKYPMLNKTLQIKCAYYSLKKVDNLEGSKRTSYDRDQRIAVAVAEEKIKELCVDKQGCLDKISVTLEDDPNLSKDYIVNFRIHQKVRWSPVFIMILPTYWSVNSSLCISADLYKSDGKELIKSYVEWGYIKEAGFWFFPFPDKPANIPLRSQLAKKVMDQVLDGVNNLK